MTNNRVYSKAPVYFHYYFGLLETDNLLAELENDRNESILFWKNISSEKEHFAYQEGKWTINQVIRHIIDTERIFAYRAMRFARFDTTDLPGFDENFYIQGIINHQEKLSNLIEEFDALRKSTIALFKSMSLEMLSFVGNANNTTCSTEGIGYFVVGHNKHHCKVMKERYLAN
jgi:hypothetical protein